MNANLPLFPELAPLDLSHQPLFAELFRELGPAISEFTFTNLYIWRHAYGTQVTRFADGVIGLLALAADPEESFIFPPLGEGASAEHVSRALGLLVTAGHDAKLCRCDQASLDRLGISETEWEIEPSRDDWDYVYRVQDLIELPEERYPDKVRHLRQFARKYEYEYRPLTPDLVPACQELQDLWCDEKHCDLHSSLRAEARAVKEILERLEELGLRGGAILVRDRVQAFTLGEPLNANTVVIHIEKASPDLHGAFQVINNEFLRHEWAEWEFVNREQDVGDAGLRKAKESYLPDHMVEKFVVRVK